VTKGKVVGRQVQRTIVGQPAAVEKLVWSLKQRGDLVAGQPVPEVVRLSGGRIAVAVKVLDRTPEPRPRRTRVRWVVAGTVAGAGVLSGVGYLVWLALPVLEGLALLAAVVFVAWMLLGQRGACPGLHCPGCKCHR
jgi:hypothetical protein